MILNGVMAVIMRYYTGRVSFKSQPRQNGQSQAYTNRTNIHHLRAVVAIL